MTAKNEKEDRTNHDIELRLEFLEKRYKDAHGYFKHTLTAITIIFLFVGLFVTGLSIISKKEINDAIANMERKFDILSGEALKKPEIELFYDDRPIGGRSIDIELPTNALILLKAFHIKNEGDREADDITIKFYFSIPIRSVTTIIAEGHLSGDPWGTSVSADKEFPGLLVYYESIALDPGETYSIFGFQAAIGEQFRNLEKIDSKIVIFFGTERPVESHMNLILKQSEQ